MDSNTRRILLAEDNSALASVIRFNLVKEGFKVTVASNGREAWDYAQQRKYDLVLTDQQMPELTGCELCERLRDKAEYAATPIIMLTAKGLELELPKLRDDLGIAATFLKPFSPKAIVQAVQDCLAAVS